MFPRGLKLPGCEAWHFPRSRSSARPGARSFLHRHHQSGKKGRGGDQAGATRRGTAHGGITLKLAP